MVMKNKDVETQKRETSWAGQGVASVGLLGLGQLASVALRTVDAIVVTR